MFVEPEVPSPSSDAADGALLARVARGDARAFGELYDRFSPILFSLAIRILRDASAAEDLLQDVFVQVWEKAPTYDPQLGRPLTWLVTLTRNRAIDRVRAQQRGQRLLEAAAAEQAAMEMSAATPAEPVAGLETAALVRAALTRLPPEQRQAIELAFFRGLTQSEIAEALTVPLGTVKARIRRGMLRLREHLEASGGL